MTQPSTKIQVDKDKVRMMVADFGYAETSARLNIKQGTLRKWAHDGKWKQPFTHSQAVTTVTEPSVAHAEALAELKGQTKLSLARSAARMAKDCEELPVKHAKLAHTVAQTYGIVHEIGENKGQAPFTLNVLNMGTLDLAVRSSASEGDSQSSGTD